MSDDRRPGLRSDAGCEPMTQWAVVQCLTPPPPQTTTTDNWSTRIFHHILLVWIHLVILSFHLPSQFSLFMQRCGPKSINSVSLMYFCLASQLSFSTSPHQMYQAVYLATLVCHSDDGFHESLKLPQTPGTSIHPRQFNLLVLRFPSHINQ